MHLVPRLLVSDFRSGAGNSMLRFANASLVAYRPVRCSASSAAGHFMCLPLVVVQCRIASGAADAEDLDDSQLRRILKVLRRVSLTDRPFRLFLGLPRALVSQPLALRRRHRRHHHNTGSACCFPVRSDPSLVLRGPMVRCVVWCCRVCTKLRETCAFGRQLTVGYASSFTRAAGMPSN